MIMTMMLNVMKKQTQQHPSQQGVKASNNQKEAKISFVGLCLFMKFTPSVVYESQACRDETPGISPSFLGFYSTAMENSTHSLTQQTHNNHNTTTCIHKSFVAKSFHVKVQRVN